MTVRSRHLFLAGGMLACVRQSQHLSAIKHVKTLVLLLILIPTKEHTLFADPLHMSWGAVPQEAASLFGCVRSFSQDRQYSEVC